MALVTHMAELTLPNSAPLQNTKLTGTLGDVVLPALYEIESIILARLYCTLHFIDYHTVVQQKII